MNKIGVIGSGYAGLSAACYLAKAGQEVSVFEKNASVGGRSRQFEESGYLFDMGPSWYWMPDVFEKFFNDFGYTTSDFYELKKLDPNFQMIFGQEEVFKIPSSWEELLYLFESIEKGAASALGKFMKEAEFKYKTAFDKLIYQPGNSILEFANWSVLVNSLRLQLLTSFKNHVRKYFKDTRLISLMEFPILFLGAMPSDTPALYSLMNYSGLKQGTFYPMGGFGKVHQAFEKIAMNLGVNIHTESPVESISVRHSKVDGLVSRSGEYHLNGLIGAADYHHIEQQLLPEDYRNYKEDYWDKKTFAPSCLLFYLGVNKKIQGLEHHNLFFDENYEVHGNEIYNRKVWPKRPLFYVCAPSKTDKTVAPEGKENLFILMPIAPGLKEESFTRDYYYNHLLSRLEKFTGEDIRSHIEVKRSYCVQDFEQDYNAYKGNAYGLANTLNQTAILKPKIRNKHLSNLCYAGQLTVPGPGVPPSIISGGIAANELIKQLKN